MKFALKVEEELNKILFPEYRQLVVEAIIIVSQLFEHNDNFRINDAIQLDRIVSNANQLFLEKQVIFYSFCFFRKIFLKISLITCFFHIENG